MYYFVFVFAAVNSYYPKIIKKEKKKQNYPQKEIIFGFSKPLFSQTFEPFNTWGDTGGG